ncbi:hypothetical protein BKA65DRAFT_196163 [Rhexocercosporidium sp. MPI-PUGE-AT-0058]|nr:hypothetical protein BKA65DRAFT_196163 [Rhexocercosporidium sp. MPI-PUGE-AT-0058]
MSRSRSHGLDPRKAPSSGHLGPPRPGTPLPSPSLPFSPCIFFLSPSTAAHRSTKALPTTTSPPIIFLFPPSPLPTPSISHLHPSPLARSLALSLPPPFPSFPFPAQPPPAILSATRARSILSIPAPYLVPPWPCLSPLPSPVRPHNLLVPHSQTPLTLGIYALFLVAGPYLESFTFTQLEAIISPTSIHGHQTYTFLVQFSLFPSLSGQVRS